MTQTGNHRRRACFRGSAGRAVLGAAALALTAGVVGGQTPATRPGPEWLDPDEKQVLRLIQQMGADRYKDRQAAHEKLKSLGPAVVPLLKPYFNHRDLEIAARVKSVMGAYKWMMTGALVTHVWRGAGRMRSVRVSEGGVTIRHTLAALLGVHVGDVLVKVDDTDVTGPEVLDALRGPGERTHYFLRQGRLVPIKVDGVLMRWTLGRWQVEKGGNDIVRGLQALQERKYDIACRRFAAAARDGFDEGWAWQTLACLAQYNFDHAAAAGYYERFRKALPEDEYRLYTTKFQGHDGLHRAQCHLHVAWLRSRLKAAPDKADLRGFAFVYFLTAAQNTNLAAAHAPTAPGTGGGAVVEYMQWLYWQGRLAEALALWRQNEDVIRGLGAREAVVEMLLRLGRYDQAADVARAERWDRDFNILASQVMAAALADGKDDLARKMLEAALSRKDESPRWFLSDVHEGGRYAWQRRVAEMILDRLQKELGRLRQLKGWEYALVRLLEQAGRAEPMDLQELVKQRKVSAEIAARTRLKMALRSGRYDAAAEQLGKIKKKGSLRSYSGRRVIALRAAVKLFQANADRLAGDWAKLKGTVYVFDGPGGEKIAIKEGGQALLIDRGGRLHPTAGLDPAVMADATTVVHWSAGTLCVQGRQVYLLDRQALRWRPAYVATYPGNDEKALRVFLQIPDSPRVLAHVIEHYPVAGYGRCLAWAEHARYGWSFWLFQGDVLIAVRDRSRRLVDLSAELARRLKRPKPVRVFRPTLLGDAAMICSEAGLWEMDRQGKLSRVELPIADNDVSVRIMEWPAVKGKLYVGVAPQQGGQVIEYDRAGGKCRLIQGGFNGFGPEDWYQQILGTRRAGDTSWPQGLDYALERSSRRRAAAVSGPATRPK